MTAKIIFFLAFLLTITINVFCLVKISKTKRSYKNPLMACIGWTIPAIIANCIIIFATSKILLLISYSIFYLSLDWILFHLLEFVIRYSRLESKRRGSSLILFVFLFADSVSLFLNVFFQHSFTLNLESKRTVFLFPYQLHLILDYIVCAMIAICLIVKCVQSAKIYRARYFQILVVFTATLIADAIYIVSGIQIDFSVIFFAIACVVISYFAFVYSPKSLINRSLTVIVENLDDPIVFFNEDNEQVFKNKAFDDFMTNMEKLGLNPKKPFAVWKGSRDFQSTEFSDFADQRFSQDIEANGKTYSFNIWFHNLKDESGRFLGTFFQIHDKTKDVERDELQKFLSTHDQLTGLYNKEAFYDKVEEFLRFNPELQYLMICLDIEHFKLINDVFSKKVGDKFLVKIARCLVDTVTTTDIYGRIGSDRFALLLEKQYFLEDLFIEKIREISHLEENESYPVICHVGVYEIEDPTIPASFMCDRALMAINSVKGNVQGVVAYYTDEMRKSVLKEQKYTGQFEEALADHQFQFFLQPQIRANGECYGAEALTRWIHPEDGLVSPADFIPTFEKNGIIATLDKYIWEEAAKKLKEWKDAGFEKMYISINISPKDLYAIDVYEFFTDLVQKYEINPRNLHLEITESAVMMNVKEQILLVNDLRKIGFLVELDDFGSGYSSYKMLKDFEFDVIKLDMDFLKETMNKERSKTILESIVNLSKELKMPVITEGVEHKEQFDFLIGIGCSIFQGYYFDKPIPVSAFEQKYMQGYKSSRT